MKNDTQLRLFLVSNPIAFSRYEDHEAALQIQLQELIEKAISDGENVIALIETYLGISYPSGNSLQEMADFLTHTDQMNFALHGLRENWDKMDESLPKDSLMYGGVTQEQAVQVFSEIDLRTYLEALSDVIWTVTD